MSQSVNDVQFRELKGHDKTTEYDNPAIKSDYRSSEQVAF